MKPGDTEIIESTPDGDLVRTYSSAGHTETWVWRVAPPPQPLDALGVAMTLFAVKGVLTTEEAATACGRAPSELVAEAEAWAAAAEIAAELKR